MLTNLFKYLGYISCLFFGSIHLASAQVDDSANTEGPQNLAELQAAVEKIRVDTKTPAIGIALVNADGSEWIAGLGLASLETQRPADEHTMFRIGSITKMFVGVAVLQLVEEGKLDLHARLSDLAPAIWYDNPWESTHPLRLVHLLEHTTGWDDMSLAEYAYPAPDTMSLKEGLNYRPASRKSRWVPGTRMAYCNTGPAVAAYIVEKITGQKFEDYVQQRIFNPLQMTDSSFYFSPTYAEKRAQLYVNNQPQDYWQIIARPAGSINASAQEMAHFLQMFIRRGEWHGQHILQPESLSRMEIHESNLGSAAGITAGYGIYNYTSGHGNYQVAFHGHNGGMPGALAELAYAPELGAGYVFMINSSNAAAVQQISQVLRSYLLREKTPPDITPTPLPETFTSLNGYYVGINPRNILSEMVNNIAAVMRFRTSEHHVHRSPLLGGWESSDIALNEQVLVDAWSGLPSIAWVTDPLAGQVVQVGSETYRPISAIRAYGVLGFNLAVLLVSLLSFICLVFWGMRRMIKKIPWDASVRVRLWPLTASGILFATILFMVIGGSMFALGTPSFVSISLMLLTLAYAAATLISVLMLWRCFGQGISRWIYGYACLYTGLHVLMLIQLTSYGYIGIRTWI